MSKLAVLWVKDQMTSGLFTLQQGGAPAHRARETVQLSERTDARLMGLKIWPPNSFDLNAVDYGIWGLLQECVYSKSIRDLEEFK